MKLRRKLFVTAAATLAAAVAFSVTVVDANASTSSAPAATPSMRSEVLADGTTRIALGADDERPGCYLYVRIPHFDDWFNIVSDAWTQCTAPVLQIELSVVLLRYGADINDTYISTFAPATAYLELESKPIACFPGDYGLRAWVYVDFFDGGVWEASWDGPTSSTSC